MPTAIRIREWTLGPGLALVSQVWERRAHDQAGELAISIHAYKIRHPGKPVVLVGHSGGCAVIVFALEALPAGVNVDSIIMLGPSISPDYNLANALRHVDGTAYSYYSHRDVGILGVATWVFGTVDRQHTASAGKESFNTPAASREIYESKLRQIPWVAEMERSGNSGGHIGWANQTFVRDYIAPKVLDEMSSHARRIAPKRAGVATQPEYIALPVQPVGTGPDTATARKPAPVGGPVRADTVKRSPASQPNQSVGTRRP